MSGPMIRLSEIRRGIAEAVAEGRVTFSPAKAEWYQDGEEVTGWRGRSLREMAQERQVLVHYGPNLGSEVVVVAVLSREVEAVLAAGPESPSGG